MQISSKKCPICSSEQGEIFFEISQVPVLCNVLFKSSVAALQAQKGDIQLVFCAQCGHIFNQLFDPARLDYTPDYENSLHFSPTFQSYVKKLASELVREYQIYNKSVIDIGCGQADFLKMLCELGDNRGIGFDPGFRGNKNGDDFAGKVRIIPDTYSEKYAGYDADLFCCRHVLEHIFKPVTFLSVIRQALGRRKSALFFEVPNAEFMLHYLAIWDIIYEHVHYFTQKSISHLFINGCFALKKVAPLYDEQFLGVEARPASDVHEPNAATPKDSQLRSEVLAFAQAYARKKAKWQERLSQLQHEQKKVVVWGSGSKGVTFLNIFARTNRIDYVIDINPRKHGMYVAGTGQKIMPPLFLQQHQPDVILVMNPIYRNEIGHNLSQLGLFPQIFSV